MALLVVARGHNNIRYMTPLFNDYLLSEATRFLQSQVWYIIFEQPIIVWQVDIYLELCECNVVASGHNQLWQPLASKYSH